MKLRGLDAEPTTPCQIGLRAAAPRPVEIIKRTDPGFVVLPKRRVIGRTFASACIDRRIARDLKRSADTVEAQIAMIKLMSRRIARYPDV